MLWVIAYRNMLVTDQRQTCSQKSIFSAINHSHGVFLIEAVQSEVVVLWVMQTAEVEESLAVSHPDRQRHTCVHVRTVTYSSLGQSSEVILAVQQLPGLSWGKFIHLLQVLTLYLEQLQVLYVHTEMQDHSLL